MLLNDLNEANIKNNIRDINPITVFDLIITLYNKITCANNPNK